MVYVFVCVCLQGDTDAGMLLVTLYLADLSRDYARSKEWDCKFVLPLVLIKGEDFLYLILLRATPLFICHRCGLASQ